MTVRPSIRLAAGALALVLAAAPARGAGAQSWRTFDVIRQLHDTTPVVVRLVYETGNVSVRPAVGGVMYGAHLRYDAERARPRYEYTPATRTLRLEIERRSGGPTRDGDAGELRVELTRRAPIDLELRLGAGEADLDLGGLRLDHLKVESGASEARVSFDTPNPDRMRALTFTVGAATLRASRLANANAEQVRVQAGVGTVDLDFGGQWRHDVELTLELTLGSATLRVPRDVGVEVEAGRRLASFDLDGLVKRGDRWVTPNWDSARHHLRVRGRVSVGSLRVETRE
jgi:hypothetical protein